MYRKLLFVIFLLLATGVFVIQGEYFSELDKYSVVRVLRMSLGQNNTPSERVSMFLAGDVMLGRTVTTTALDKYNDPNYPFYSVAERMRGADIVFVNLESPIVKGCPRSYKALTFCADPQMVRGLGYAGVDVVTLANNHSNNYGEVGVEDTQKYLSSAEIKYTGLGKLVGVEKNGTSYGFLGFDLVTHPELTQVNLDLVEESDGKVDVLVVGVHWGWEYRDVANDNQKRWARQLVENGTDIVVGHHPHWIQEMEYIDNVPVYYSLGNFVFDQMWSEKTRLGAVVELVFEGSELVDEQVSYVYMKEWAQPEFVEN